MPKVAVVYKRMALVPPMTLDYSSLPEGLVSILASEFAQKGWHVSPLGVMPYISGCANGEQNFP